MSTAREIPMYDPVAAAERIFPPGERKVEADFIELTNQLVEYSVIITELESSVGKVREEKTKRQELARLIARLDRAFSRLPYDPVELDIAVQKESDELVRITGGNYTRAWMLVNPVALINLSE